MPQLVKHTRDQMLDAARRLILDGGPAAATARAVSAATGAPTGSLYHQFPGRDDLVACAWLRAQDRFLGAYLPALTDEGDEGAVEAAVRVLTWSSANPDDAALLLRHALRDLLRGDVSAQVAAAAQAGDERLQAAVLACAGDRPLATAMLALVDLPYAMTRRVLREQRAATEEEIRTLRHAVQLLWVGL